MRSTSIQGKIHRIRITDLKPSYNGSCLICPDLMEAAEVARLIEQAVRAAGD